MPLNRARTPAWLLIAFVLAGLSPLRGEADRIALITAAFGARLDAIQCREDGFADFCRRHPDLFPRQGEGEWVRVRKEILTLDKGHTVAIGAAYSQVFIPAAPERVARYLESPQWFRCLYDLDADAAMGEVRADGSFKARIYKRIPLLPDQDFVLAFTRVRYRTTWLQRGRLVEDRKGFAVRDNLKILEPRAGGVMYREISLVYPRRWWARAMGGTFRRVMRREVRDMLRVLRCVISGGPVPDPQRVSACRRQARGD